jgi:hypothetical protein
MRLRHRVARLEGAARQAAATGPAEDGLTDEEWLAQFEAYGREGCFAAEPDFPAALAAYRRALEQAASQADPPFDPPAGFLPALTDLPHLRLRNWRNPSRFPAVHAAWDGLAEMLGRVWQGTPPLTEAEFDELAAWFGGNQERLYRRWGPDGLIELGDGRRVSVSNIRYGLQGGPRVSGAGELAEDVRRLRALLSEGEP